MDSILIVALALGMRHGTDPDHLTAIDGLCRIRPRATNGLLFALGHGVVVTILAVGVGSVVSNRLAFLGPWLLISIGAINLWRVFRPAHAHLHVSPRSFIARPFFFGMILAAGFETSSQLAALFLTNQLSPWLVGLAFTLGMVLVDGVDGYLASSTQRMAIAGSAASVNASRALGILVVIFSFGLGGAELIGVDFDHFALPVGIALFATVIAIRAWARAQKPAPALAIATAV